MDYVGFRTTTRAEAARANWMHAELAGVHVVEGVADKINWLMTHALAWPDDDVEANVIQELLTKACHELYAFVGAMRAGSLVGGYHHIRSLIELRAVRQYVWGTAGEHEVESRVRRRCLKYLQWPHVNPYCVYRRAARRLERAIDESLNVQLASSSAAKRFKAWSRLTQAQTRFNVETRAIFRADSVEKWPTDAVLAEWVDTYAGGEKQKDKAKAQEKLASGELVWHSPASIVDLVGRLPNPHIVVASYDLACNCTHVSTLSNHIADRQGVLRPQGWEHRNGLACGHFALYHALLFCQELDADFGNIFVPLLAAERKALHDSQQKNAHFFPEMGPP